MHHTDRDAEPVESAGGDDEPEAVRQAALAGRELGPVAWPWKMANAPTSTAAATSAGFPSSATMSPSRSDRERDADLDAG